MTHVELEGLESMEFNKATLEKTGKEIKFSAGSTVQKGDVSVDLTPTVTIGDGSVKIGMEKSELKDDNPGSKDNKRVSEIKAGSPDFDQKKMSDNIQKRTTESKEQAALQGPGKITSKGTTENKDLKAAMESKIKTEDQNAKAKAAESNKEPDKKENK